MAAQPASRLDASLRRDRMVVLAAIVAITLLASAYLVPMALDMYGAMTGPARWMMAGNWDARYALLMFLMWAVMMIGMMLPSAAPMLLLYAAVVRRSGTPPGVRVQAFGLGYVLAWTAFSLLATALQWLLGTATLLTPMMVSATPVVSAFILIAAGLYQFTPLKQSCLQHCRAPASFIAEYWRPGAAGALRMGLRQGLYCVGCCWALMGLLFFGGVMNLLCIAAIMLFVLLEKVLPPGAHAGPVAGLLLIVGGLLVLWELK